MLRASLLLVWVLCVSSFSYAQPENKEKKRERIEAQRIAFISAQVKLTPKEAQIFWPVYNLYAAEIEAVRKERRTYTKQLRRSKELDGDRAYELFELMFENEKKESDIRLKYLIKFSEVLGKKKAANVFVAEEKFKRELLRKLKKEGNKPNSEHSNRN